ncbi:hypothetical protein [Sphingomonas yantingensis]|uniref:Uncharacterized protein n=1 Tax=Sphingomonas yantingensis TaxID=1241761 RepID=A0A7W9AQ30_9SPHN|nr:hypothetical protein [Sphingomonas yantingensis]MBB5698507.1 hypothetical protein [Sphingomonas yantingensis]
MLHFYDRATMAAALTMDLEPRLKALLTARIEALPPELIDWTEYVVVEEGDTEADIVAAVGFSPLVEPIEGVRYGQPGFEPFWDLLIQRDGWSEMVVTFGSTFACVLLIERGCHAPRQLDELCSRYGSSNR